ncbi:MAG: hypothetical protein QOD65_2251 [Gaiellales bacterium]|jgi:hypothetical protein|nr:hypothetical protein [Gaiellales bacterium]
MEEDRHLDGRACLAVACGIASLLVVFLSPEIGIFFAAFAWIFAGASVIAVDEPASPRTRRTALLATLPTLPALVALVLLLLTFGERSE